jgi:hypothetical protein
MDKDNGFVFSFTDNLIGFCSFANRLGQNSIFWINAFGGLFYLLISVVFFYIRPHRYAELQIAQCIKLTSNYLKLRGDLWELNSDRKTITEKQLNLQVQLNTIHEK